MSHRHDDLEQTLRFQLSLLRLFAANRTSDAVPKAEAVKLEEMVSSLVDRG